MSVNDSTPGPSTLPAVIEAPSVALTEQAKLELLAVSIRESGYAYDEDDMLLLAQVATFECTDREKYAEGFELLRQLLLLQDRISDSYVKFSKPLAYLGKVITNARKPMLDHVSDHHSGLSRLLGMWKQKSDDDDRRRAREEQEARDVAARAAQEAKAAALMAVAAATVDPSAAASIAAEAARVQATPVQGAVVETKATAPAIPGGTVPVTYTCEFQDLKKLMAAYAEGKCFFPDEVLLEKGLQGYMDKQAADLKVNLGRAFPGCVAKPSYKAQAKRQK